jgi:hypothetical protein
MRRQTWRTTNIDDCVVQSVRKEEIPICVDFRSRAWEMVFFFRFFLSTLSFGGALRVCGEDGYDRRDDDGRRMGVDWDGWGDGSQNGWNCGCVL